MQLKPTFKATEPYKTLFNIGAGFDIPTSYWVPGRYGEMILMGGLAPLTSMVGPGKMYKSTILHYMLLSAMAKIFAATPTSCMTYDSETNIHIQRLQQFSRTFEEFGKTDIIEEGHWVVSDSGSYLGDEWWSGVRDFMKDKRKNAKEFQVELPFNGRDGKPVKETITTFAQIDSLTAMQLSAGVEIMDKNDIGDSGGSHLFMREGLGKAQMLHELPALGAACKHYFLTTAHIGDRNGMSSGPAHLPPKKQLAFLPTDIKIKGVTGQFLYQQHNLWLVTNCALLWNKDDKTPRYPKLQGQAVADDKDLNLVTIQHVRGNAGPSGFRLDVVVSQSEGVLPSLTEFHQLKDYESFGFEGNDRSYRLCLYPEVTLQRTTVRQLLDSDAKLRRAMNITSELAQMHQFHKPYVGEKLMGADQLYAKIKELGYDWNFILENTRGWWTYSNESVNKFFLSTLDLLNMAHGLYHPYWLEADKTTIKKQFARKA